MASSDVLILGAGPAGLTAALELLRKTTFRPVILEASSEVGGICRRLPLGSGFVDFGGHRFHTHSKRVQDFWLSVMPLKEEGFHLKQRRSKLYFQQNLFEYPVSPSWKTFSNLGIRQSLELLQSYLLRPKLPASSLEAFFISTYGVELYRLFFRDYTEKVWGRPCREISSKWATERLAGPKVVVNSSNFLYPTGGPGSFWQKVAKEIEIGGGVIHLNHRVEKFHHDGQRVQGVETAHGRFSGSHYLSTLSLSSLLRLLDPRSQAHLPYRSLISVNFALERSRLQIGGGCPQWIYVNHPLLKASRLQFYRAWDESMVKDPSEEIIGVEYFVNAEDPLWQMSEEELEHLAFSELRSLGIYQGESRRESKVFRYKEAYPCYWGDFSRLEDFQKEIDVFDNLFSFGRQGLHRYINMDQAMMSALRVVDFLRFGGRKSDLWNDFTDLHLPE